MGNLTPQLWTNVLSELSLQMTRGTFDNWLRGSQLVASNNGNGACTCTIAVRHRHAVDWLENRLRPLIEDTLSRHAGQPVHITFDTIAPAQTAQPGTNQPDDEPGDPPGDQVMIEAVRENRVTVQENGQALTWTDFYIKLKTAFRRRALRKLKGAKLSIFICLALHVDRDGVAAPGIDSIMRETGYGRATVCSGLDELESLGIIEKRASYRGNDEYVVRGYAWFGPAPAPALWEVESKFKN